MKKSFLRLFLIAAVFLFGPGCGGLTVEPYEPSIRVLVPRAGDTLEAGATCSIQQDISGLRGDSVFATLEGGGLGAPLFIAALPAGSTFFQWTVPLSLPADDRYFITLTSPDDDSLSGSSAFFTIVNDADGYEPDDSVSLAKEPGIEGTLQYRTVPRSDVDWCRFEAAAGMTYCFQTFGTTDTYLDLFMENGTTLLAHDDNEGEGVNGLIFWECTASAVCFLRISAKTSGRPQPYLLSSRAGPALIEIVFPDSGRQLAGGDAVAVEWKRSAGSGASVSLYLRDSDTLVSTIAQGTSNDGNFVWTVPYTLASSTDYRIRITCDDYPSVADTSGPFKVSNVPVALTVTAPGPGYEWNTGNSYIIYWTSSGNPGPTVRLSLYDAGDLFADITAGASTSAGLYVWTLPWTLPTSTAYQIKITSAGDSSIHDFSGPFTIIKTLSTLTVTSPTSDSNWTTGTPHYVRWTSSGNPGAYVSIALYDGDTQVTAISAGAVTSNGRFLWDIPWTLPTSDAYRVKITSAIDTSVYGWSPAFKLTHIDPVITVTAPAAGAVWNAGTSKYIFWNSSTTVPGNYVAVSLYDSSQEVMTIEPATSRSNGSCYWTLPLTLAGGTSYRIKVMSTSDTSVYGFSGYFSITGQPDRLTLTSPVSGSSWTAGQYYTIYWTCSGPSLPGTEVMLLLYDSAQLIETLLPRASVANLSFFWQVPSSQAAGSGYRIKISSLTLDTVYDFSDYFIITNPALIGDAYEPDSIPAQAAEIVKDGAAQSRTLSDEYDTDWIKFTAVSGTAYTIETWGATDTYIDLFGTDGVSLIASDDDSGEEYPNAKIVWTCPASGTYYFTVAGWDVGSYTVTLR
ncbi:MAG: hypothetical protein JW699_06150 [Chitinispirillaceae bacterium]|nr:hypothetical protein [Chitinispirillaceae bacterium]